MSIEEQIAEMERYILEVQNAGWQIVDDTCAIKDVKNSELAEYLYHAGYRKATDVAADIFAEIMQAMRKGVEDAKTKTNGIAIEILDYAGGMYTGCIGKAICDVFKKYTESEGAE